MVCHVTAAPVANSLSVPDASRVVVRSYIVVVVTKVDSSESVCIHNVVNGTNYVCICT